MEDKKRTWFDKFGTKKNKTKPPKVAKKTPNGPQGPRSTSMDVEDPRNEALEEEIRGLKTLPAKEFDKKFEKMLDEMNLTENLKKPVRAREFAAKCDMLGQFMRRQNIKFEKSPEVVKKYPNAPASAFAEVKDSYSESQEEVIQGLRTLSTKEFNKKFEEMMDEMNLTENLKKPVRARDFSTKCDMLGSFITRQNKKEKSKE